jgi:dsRNA-specific ribonuclease
MLFRNLPLINAALTSPATQILNNNERLEIYGNSVISLLAIIEIYLTRESSYTENDLDYLKKQRISIDKFIRINTEHKIYEYMMVEP